ncbi:NiFe hydrogenase [Shewanella sp. BF02_Schw]|uniref:NiFe hydrogenase n=1 Tax=Shewanella sp. BF02_Schw TaxID=394908 RepID=UPI00178516B0|nr:NiFe hydrogenase [Shewanella sp. BF02_Schw]MBO1895415.1 NiFe hydrogenase [Shewanella sp. BF02_Schw]
MSMHNIRFDFVCQRHVPLYEHLCNQYLERNEFNISIGAESEPQTSKIRYFIEAFATQAQLEALADEIASDFLLSVWLLDTHIQRIEQHSGQRKPFKIKPLYSGLPLYFCQHCQPQFGDNQHPSFGDINLQCHHCMGHEKLSRDEKSLTQADIAAMANRLLSHKALPLPILGITLWLTPPAAIFSSTIQPSTILPSTISQNADDQRINSSQTNAPITAITTTIKYQRPRILVCNPNSLNSHFIVNDSQVLALSSIEKPLLRVRPSSDHPSLLAPLYEIQFAENRLLVILTEVLRQKGINWLHVTHDIDLHTSQEALLNKPLRLASVNQQWLPITTLGNGTIPLPTNVTCLHDEHHYQDDLHTFTVQSSTTDINWRVSDNDAKPSNSRSALPLAVPAVLASSCADDSSTITNDITTSLCALNAAVLRCDPNKNHHKAQFVKHAAVLYFSQHNTCQIVTLDSQSKPELFFQLPTLPTTGYEICHSLSESPQKSLLDKFKQLFPAEYNQLLDLHIQANDGALSQLMAVATLIIGAYPVETAQRVTVTELADKFIALAMAHHGNNAPRIDFPLTKGAAHRSLNWCKTFGSLMSFKLAGETNLAKLAFAFHDSFADYLSHWVEHLDQNIGVKQLVIAGSEFANPVLTDRVQLRIGKNFPLLVNPLLDLDGVNIAIGGLYLKQRRG